MAVNTVLTEVVALKWAEGGEIVMVEFVEELLGGVVCVSHPASIAPRIQAETKRTAIPSIFILGPFRANLRASADTMDF